MTIRFGTMTDWRNSPIAAGLVIGAFVAIQLAIPVSRLSDDNPHRFAWQMFSVTREAPEFVAHTSSSGDIEIELENFVARARGDIDLEAALPPHLCRVIPNADKISWENGQHQC